MSCRRYRDGFRCRPGSAKGRSPHGLSALFAFLFPAEVFTRRSGRCVPASVLEELLEELLEQNLDGFECWYSRFTADQRRRMVRIARNYGVSPTGGSDYHGSYKPDLSIGVGTGDLQIPFEVFEELRDRAQKFTQ